MKSLFSQNFHLVPLRIPAGWSVSFNIFFQEELFLKKENPDVIEHLLSIRQEEPSDEGEPLFAIDLDWWLPDRHYRLNLFFDREKELLKTYESEHISEIQGAIDQWLHVLSKPYFELENLNYLLARRVNKSLIMTKRREESYQLVCALNNLTKMRRRPIFNDLIVNDGKTGIQIIDPQSGETIEQIVFPSPFRAKVTTITQWCLRADGQAMVAFDEENQQACWIALDGSRQSYDLLNYPIWNKKTTDLYYLWEDGLFLVAGSSFQIYKLNFNSQKFEIYNFKAKKEKPEWIKIKKTLWGMEYDTLRIESDRARVLYYSHPKIGIAQWGNEAEINFKTPFLAIVSQLAAAGDQIFAMQPNEVTRFDKIGFVLEILYPPKDYFFVDLDVLEDEQMLILACQSKSLPGNSQLLSYKLV